MRGCGSSSSTSSRASRIQTFRLLRRFLRFIPLRDVIYLVVKPFLGKKTGATNAEVVSRAIEHPAQRVPRQTSPASRTTRWSFNSRIRGRARWDPGDGRGRQLIKEGAPDTGASSQPTWA